MSGGISISLQELIKSNCLSTCTFSCHNRHHNHVTSKDLQCLNACKLSLLLVQTVARYGNDEGIDYFSTLALNNFILTLHNEDLGNIEVVGDEEDDDDDYDYDDTLPLDFKSEPTFDENDETTLDILFELFTDDAHATTGGTNNNDVQNGQNENEHIVTRRRSSLISHASSQMSSHDKDKFDIILRANGHEVHWTLVGMEIRVHDKNEEKKSELLSTHDPPEISMLQIIGKLICQIFSHQYNNKQATLPSIFKRLSIVGQSVYYQYNNGDNELEQQCNNGDNELEQRTKRVYKEESLFSELIDNGYPVSICRLLSDMIDIGINGKADSPFTTLDDVITDLEQMATYPELFLYNPEDSFSSNLRFGVGCYGRESQVASILGVASKLEGNNIQGSSPPDGLEAIFISGIAGSGKSFLAHKTAECLEKSSSSWIVIGAKFEMGLEHKSRDVVCSVFDTLVTNLLTMRDGNIEEDIQYCHRASKAISDLLDRDDITSLASVIPRIQDLLGDGTFDEDHSDSKAAGSDDKCSYWRLVFLLSSLLGALVSLDRKILVYYDDLQWCNPSMTSLICEVIQSLAKLPRAKDWFLFMGLYRDNEVDVADSSLFMKQYEGLQQNENINVTSINLPSFTKVDLTNMMMAEMRLPLRLVVDFAGIVHRKTSGHALFVVQLLNSLVRDAVIIYSPTKHRYYWNNKQLDEVQMGDSVASMIVSNLSCLSEADLQCLRVLSCFGQVHQSIIHHLASCSDINGAFDIVSSLQSLVDAGIIEVSSTSMLQFSHDLIHQQVYNEIAIEQRHQLHLSIGLSLGSETSLDADGKRLNSSSTQNASDIDINGNNLKEGEPIDSTTSSLPKSIASIATHHINNAAEVIVDRSQRVRFACWNAVAANQQSSNSNFQSALHYYKKGIEFLGGWASDAKEISYKLHKGIAATLLSLGKEEKVTKYATIIIENVPFERSLEAQTLLIRSLQQRGSKDKEAIAMAIALLRKLGGFNIPSYTQTYTSYFVAGVSSMLSTSSASPLLSVKVVAESIARIDDLSLKYNLDDRIDQMTVIVDRSKRDMLDVLECIILSCLRTRSPYLPIIVCEMINYSLENDCLCGESALCFAIFGYMKIWINGKFISYFIFACTYSNNLTFLILYHTKDDWEGARRWGKLTTRILDKFKCHQFICARVTYFTLLQVWDRSLKENAHELLKVHEMGMKAGEVESSNLAIAYHLRYSLFDGEMSLWTLKAKYDLYLVEMQKYNKTAAKTSVLDSFLIHLLIGLPCKFAIFDGKINNLDELLEDVKNNRMQTISIYYARFFQQAWFGNMKEASDASKKILTFASRWLGPMPIRVYHTFFNGIVNFQLYREGGGDAYFDEGVRMLDKLKKWEQCSALIVKTSMSLLLTAEFYASNCEVNKAKETYKATIQSSKTYSEQAVAYEKMGNYLSEICEVSEAQEMHKNAYVCYKKWGAKAVADKLLKEHPFELSELEESAINSMKRKGDSESSDDDAKHL